MSVSHGRLSFLYSLLFFSFDVCPIEPCKSIGCICMGKLKAAVTEKCRSPFPVRLRRSVVAYYLPCDSLTWSTIPFCCINDIQMYCIAENTLPRETKAHADGSIIMRSILRLPAIVSASIGGPSSSDILKPANLTYGEGHTRAHIPAAAAGAAARQ